MDQEYMLEDLLHTASRKAVSKNMCTHDGTFQLFKSTSAFRKTAVKQTAKKGIGVQNNTLDDYYGKFNFPGTSYEFEHSSVSENFIFSILLL